VNLENKEVSKIVSQANESRTGASNSFHIDTSYLLQHSFTKRDLERCASGLLFGAGNAQLPSSPLMMLDRVVDIRSEGGEYGRGYASAELDIDPNSWFFKCHFDGDAVMPGSLLIEALWQLTGFQLAWSGHTGKGRVLESGTTKFIEPVSPELKMLSISIQVRNIRTGNPSICVANGEVKSNGIVICRASSIKVALVKP